VQIHGGEMRDGLKLANKKENYTSRFNYWARRRVGTMGKGYL